VLLAYGRRQRRIIWRKV